MRMTTQTSGSPNGDLKAKHFQKRGCPHRDTAWLMSWTRVTCELAQHHLNEAKDQAVCKWLQPTQVEASLTFLADCVILSCTGSYSFDICLAALTFQIQFSVCENMGNPCERHTCGLIHTKASYACPASFQASHYACKVRQRPESIV